MFCVVDALTAQEFHHFPQRFGDANYKTERRLFSKAVVINLWYAYPGVEGRHLREYGKLLTSNKTKHRKRFNLQPALIHALTEDFFRI
jgi:hypothetical protein